MKKKNILFICLAVFLQTIAFAQMQSYMTYSAERGLNNTSLVYINPKVETVKVEKLSNDTIITLCRDKNTDLSYFLLTVSSSTFARFHEVHTDYKVYDFKILGNYIYFCGKVFNPNSLSYTGFVARANLQIFFFALYPNNIFYSNTIDPTEVVYELEVYNDPSTTYPRISALGHNSTNNKYYFFDFDITLGTGPYYVFETERILQDITQTQNYIAVTFSTDYPQGEFGVMRHKKINIFDCQSQIFDFVYNGNEAMGLMRRPEDQLKCYLSENIEGTDVIFIATTMEINKNLPSPFERYNRSINIYHISLDNISLLKTQLFPLSGKPYIKDMFFKPQDATLYLLSNISLCNDLNYIDIPCIDGILEVKPIKDTTYVANFIIPSQSRPTIDKMNSIASYEDNNKYYISAGVMYDNVLGDKMYWFDKEASLNVSASCSGRKTAGSA